MGLTEQITLVENALRDLIREWERFFAGDIRVPPQPAQAKLARRLRALSEEQTQRGADRFRIEQLQHRYATYSTNWERLLREREEGRGRFAASGRFRPPQEAPAANEAGTGSVQLAEDRALYDRYVAAKRAHGQEVQGDREAFVAQLAGERQKLEAKLGPGVWFDVLVDGGKVKLAAHRERRAGKGT
jgi:hypothetical protein